jgi:hypothetical protein
VHPGYRQMQFSRADVLYPNGAALDPAYRKVDSYVAEAETFHDVKWMKKITIVVCRNWGDCERFATPFLGRPLAVTIPTGTVIFVTPKAVDFRADIAELLRHELSHAVLTDRSVLNVFRMQKQPCRSCGHTSPMQCRRIGVSATRHIFTSGTGRLSAAGKRRFLDRAGVLLRPAGVPKHLLRRLRNGPSGCSRRLSGRGAVGTDSDTATDCVLNSWLPRSWPNGVLGNYSRCGPAFAIWGAPKVRAVEAWTPPRSPEISLAR